MDRNPADVFVFHITEIYHFRRIYGHEPLNTEGSTIWMEEIDEFGFPGRALNPLVEIFILGKLSTKHAFEQAFMDFDRLPEDVRWMVLGKVFCFR